ncbi:MAG: alpha/beta hydrolase [Planctomycetota bacterium]
MLHPQAKEFLDQVAQMDPPAWESLPVEEARKRFADLTPMYGLVQPVRRVEDLEVAGVSCRSYAPECDSVIGTLVYFHGGGWVIGDLSTHDALCRNLSNQLHVNVISVDYALSPEHRFPFALDQCHEVVKAIANDSSLAGFDSLPLVVGGDSAGGNLAAMTALRDRDESSRVIAAQILIYPVIEPIFDSSSYEEFADGFGLTRDNMRYFWDCYLGSGAKPAQAAASSASSHDNLPPAIVLTAGADVLRDEGERYARILSDSGVAMSFRRFEGMIHGFVHLASIFNESANEANQWIAEELRKHLT